MISLARGVYIYCKYQQSDLETSATHFLPTDLTMVCARRKFARDQGVGDCLRKDLVNIESLENQTLPPLHYAPLPFSKERSVVCSRQEFARDKGLGDQLRDRIR